MGHCLEGVKVQKICTLAFISILYLTYDNYYFHNEHYICYLCINSKLCLVLYIIILMLVQSKTSRKPWPRLDRFVIFFILLFFKLINDFLVINSLLLKIKYKLYVSVLFTSIPFVFASIFQFTIRGPNPGNSPLQCNISTTAL